MFQAFLDNLNGKVIAFCGTAGFLGAVVDALLGGWCYHLSVLFILMCIDFLTGLLLAAFFGNSSKSETGGLSSMSCWRGLVKKVVTIGVVVAAYQADRLIGVDFTKKAVVIGFCVAELISICENARAMDVLPDAVNDAFDKVFKILNKKEDKDDDDDPRGSK